MDTDYQNKHYNINQKDEGTQDDRGRNGGTNFILRIEEQETRLTPQKQMMMMMIKYHENSVQWEPWWSMRTDGQTDTTRLTVAFRNFGNAPKNSVWTDGLTHTILHVRSSVQQCYTEAQRSNLSLAAGYTHCYLIPLGRCPLQAKCRDPLSNWSTAAFSQIINHLIIPRF